VNTNRQARNGSIALRPSQRWGLAPNLERLTVQKLDLPIHLLFSILLSLSVILLFAIAGLTAKEENWAIISSFLAASACALAIFTALPTSRNNSRQFLTLTFFFLLKTTAPLLYFYNIVEPYTILSSEPVGLKGDSAAIHNAALIFKQTFESDGLFSALFGDYYRAINNPGVGVFYGLLYQAFGPYTTSAIPWNALADTLTVVACISASRLSRPPTSADFTLVALLFLMPSFFVGPPPNYRDHFMVLLIALACYSVGYTALGKSGSKVTSLIVAVFAAALLTTLRLGFAASLLFVGSAAVMAFSQSRNTALQIALTVATAACVYGLSLVDAERVSSQASANILGGGNPVLNFIYRSCFIGLTPFPWWQRVEAELYVWQIWDYGQTFLFILVCVLLLAKRRDLSRDPFYIYLLLCFAGFFLMTVVGSGLHQRYLQIALPLLLIPASALITKKAFFESASASALLIGVAHLLYFARS
jgi:hypothetical protein